jgi:hypothetical protein
MHRQALEMTALAFALLVSAEELRQNGLAILRNALVAE